MNTNLRNFINEHGEFDVKVAESNLKYYEQLLDIRETEDRLVRYEHALEMKQGVHVVNTDIAVIRNLIEQHEDIIERYYQNLQHDRDMDLFQGVEDTTESEEYESESDYSPDESHDEDMNESSDDLSSVFQ